jgi:hypothetical protein
MKTFKTVCDGSVFAAAVLHAVPRAAVCSGTAVCVRIDSEWFEVPFDIPQFNLFSA